MKNIVLILMFIFSYFSSYSQGDCPGEIICVNTTAAVVNGINDSELNLTYSGCLPTGEAPRSVWYQFCVSTTGTIRFNINPNGGSNDYDWALWGPNSNCPPITTPLRCSYALVGGGSDNTGVNSANNAPQTDFTEGFNGNQWTQDVNAVAGQCFVLLINNYGGGSNFFSISFGGTATLLCSALPIELISFDGEKQNNYNLLNWSTASETNNDYFTLERSIDGENWEAIKQIDGFGNSSSIIYYSYEDYDFEYTTNYYRLSQTDFNGDNNYFNPIVIDNSDEKLEIIRIINFMGQDVKEDYEGIKIVYYSDGLIIKKVGR